MANPPAFGPTGKPIYPLPMFKDNNGNYHFYHPTLQAAPAPKSEPFAGVPHVAGAIWGQIMHDNNQAQHALGWGATQLSRPVTLSGNPNKPIVSLGKPSNDLAGWAGSKLSAKRPTKVNPKAAGNVNRTAAFTGTGSENPAPPVVNPAPQGGAGNPGTNGTAGSPTPPAKKTAAAKQISFQDYVNSLGFGNLLGNGSTPDFAAQVAMAMKPILDQFQSQQDLLGTQRQNDIANAQGFYKAVGDLLAGQGKDVNQMYQDAGKNMDSFGSGFQAAMQQHQDANQTQIDSLLNQNGAPASQLAQVNGEVNGAAPALLNYMGALPASIFAQEGPAFGKAADGHTYEALGQEQLANSKTNQQYRQDMTQLNASRLSEMDKVPGMIQTARNDYSTQSNQRQALLLSLMNAYANQTGTSPFTGARTVAGQNADTTARRTEATVTGYDPATGLITPAYAKTLQSAGIAAQKFKTAAQAASRKDYMGGMTSDKFYAKKGTVDDTIGAFLSPQGGSEVIPNVPSALKANPGIQVKPGTDPKGKTFYTVSWAKPPRWETVFMSLVQIGIPPALAYREMRDQGYPGVPAKWQG